LTGSGSGSLTGSGSGSLAGSDSGSLTGSGSGSLAGSGSGSLTDSGVSALSGTVISGSLSDFSNLINGSRVVRENIREKKAYMLCIFAYMLSKYYKIANLTN
jgi:hypothetical protein